MVLDSIPLALGLLVDGLAGTRPVDYPDGVYIPLQPGSEEILTPLPDDAVLLGYWHSQHADRCFDPRLRSPNADPERWVANYLPVPTSVSVQGKRIEKIHANEDAEPSDAVVFQDDIATIEIAPSRDTIDLRLSNRTARSLKVHWDDAVFVDFDKISKPLDRNDGGSTHDSQVIAPGTSIEETVYPVSRLFERSTTIRTMDRGCLQQCQQMAYQCMAAYNCSGYRSRNPYTGDYWALYAVLEGIDAGLCERRCAGEAQACMGSCGRTVQQSDGPQHLPIVPNLIRTCSQSEEDLIHAAEDTTPQTYAVLLPIEIGSATREYLINFEAEVFQYEPGEGCPSTKR